MRLKMYGTLIKADHKLGGNDFIIGKISGIGTMVCGTYDENRIPYAGCRNDKGYVYIVESTPRKYAKFKDVVEHYYPGLCIFDYKGESK